MITLILAGMLLGSGDAVEVIGRLDHSPIREASGLVASRQFPGVFWVHNDSGNPPALFAVRRDGALIREYSVAATNLDWEDLANDDDGYLYLGDIGNNGGILPLRTVYRIEEPDPSHLENGPLSALRLVTYGFADGRRFDAEGLVVGGVGVLVIEKRFDGREARVFGFPIGGEGTLLRPAMPKQVASLTNFTEPVTGADLSPDGYLAVASLGVARVYKSVGDLSWELVATVPYRAAQVEAIAWDGDDLILASEDRLLYRIPASAWQEQEPGG